MKQQPIEDSVSTGRSTASSTETASADTGVATADGSYSQTNVRQSGVDEGDIVKNRRDLSICAGR